LVWVWTYFWRTHPHARPEGPAPTPVLSSTTTSSPEPSPRASSSFARCQDVESPWTPAPMTTPFALRGNDTDLLPIADRADAEQGPVGSRHRRPPRAAPIGLVD